MLILFSDCPSPGVSKRAPGSFRLLPSLQLMSQQEDCASSHTARARAPRRAQAGGLSQESPSEPSLKSEDGTLPWPRPGSCACLWVQKLESECQGPRIRKEWCPWAERKLAHHNDYIAYYYCGYKDCSLWLWKFIMCHISTTWTVLLT